MGQTRAPATGPGRGPVATGGLFPGGAELIKGLPVHGRRLRDGLLNRHAVVPVPVREPGRQTGGV